MNNELIIDGFSLFVKRTHSIYINLRFRKIRRH